jgi:hypothetical protein
MNKRKKYVLPGVERQSVKLEGLVAQSYSPKVNNQIKYTDYEEVDQTVTDVLIF